MFVELIAVFAAGIGAAGLALLLRRIVPRLPRWAVPVAAGLAMIGVTLWSELTWAERTVATLPEGVEVVDRTDERMVWKPWTFVVPQTTRFVALDAEGVQSNPDHPETRLVDVYLFARWQPPRRLPQLVDCVARARADVSDDALADPGVAPWVDADTALVEAACKE